VKLVKGLKDDDGVDLFGQTDVCTQEIRLDADNPLDVQKTTLMHEIFHCILQQTYHDLEFAEEERFVRAVDNMTVDTLRRNRKAAQYMLEV
jgi:hypothetical protein